MQIERTSIPGCCLLTPSRYTDKRGSFVKTFHEPTFVESGLAGRFAEDFYSVSQRGVLRGLHFQLPPMEQAKLVYCIKGEVFDAVVDLRIGSPTFGKFETFILSAEQANMVYIPRGLAHGFYVSSPEAIMCYKVTVVYSPMHDSGILWSSVGIPWHDTNPVLSSKDSLLAPFAEFRSPFSYLGDGIP